MTYQKKIKNLLEKEKIEYKGFSGIGLDFKCLYYGKDGKGASTISGANYKEVYYSLLEAIYFKTI